MALAPENGHGDILRDVSGVPVARGDSARRYLLPLPDGQWGPVKGHLRLSLDDLEAGPHNPAFRSARSKEAFFYMMGTLIFKSKKVGPSALREEEKTRYSHYVEG